MLWGHSLLGAQYLASYITCIVSSAFPYEVGIIIGSTFVMRKPKSRKMKSFLTQG